MRGGFANALPLCDDDDDVDGSAEAAEWVLPSDADGLEGWCSCCSCDDSCSDVAWSCSAAVLLLRRGRPPRAGGRGAAGALPTAATLEGRAIAYRRGDSDSDRDGEEDDERERTQENEFEGCLFAALEIAEAEGCQAKQENGVDVDVVPEENHVEVSSGEGEDLRTKRRTAARLILARCFQL
jgi:hypothetical protein